MNLNISSSSHLREHHIRSIAMMTSDISQISMPLDWVNAEKSERKEHTHCNTLFLSIESLFYSLHIVFYISVSMYHWKNINICNFSLYNAYNSTFKLQININTSYFMNSLNRNRYFYVGYAESCNQQSSSYYCINLGFMEGV